MLDGMMYHLCAKIAANIGNVKSASIFLFVVKMKWSTVTFATGLTARIAWR